MIPEIHKGKTMAGKKMKKDEFQSTCHIFLIIDQYFLGVGMTVLSKYLY
jgi:hypothetical protein